MFYRFLLLPTRAVLVEAPTKDEARRIVERKVPDLASRARIRRASPFWISASEGRMPFTRAIPLIRDEDAEN
jgi:hypothetical protein